MEQAPVLMVEPPETTEAAPETPPRLQMSYEEYLAWTGEDTRAEWVNGEVIVCMPPKLKHQNLATFIATLLRLFSDRFGRGLVLSAPFEVKLWPDGPSREPDIIFVAQANLARLTEHRVVGPPDLVVEIISDDSVARDRSDKFYEYQQASVPEYWLFDPRPGKQRMDFWTLDAQGRYRPVPLDDAGVYRSTILPGFWLKDEWLLAETPPDAFTTFAQIVGLPLETGD